MPTASLELFPERPAGVERALKSAAEFAPGKPSFVSVTSSQLDYTKTIAMCSRLLAQEQVPMAHLLCGGRPRKQIDAMIDATTVAGITHVLALRGDVVEEGAEAAITDTAELVKLLAQREQFQQIMVAGYPDVHPSATDVKQDLEHLHRKVAAGATRVITQFSFEVDTLLRYREQLNNFGINVPISVGLLPIRNFQKMLNFAKRCQACVPVKLHEQFSQASEADHPAMAQELLTNMTVALTKHGFDIHFYTLNSVAMVNEAWAAASSETTALAS